MQEGKQAARRVAERARRRPALARAQSQRRAPLSPAAARRDTVQLYKQLYDSGLQYGPSFRLLRNVHVPESVFNQEPEGAK